MNNVHFVSIVAHPIDETKCVGGTFMRAVRTGHRGTNVVCVHPNGRGEWPIPESVPDSELAEYIAAEGRRAARMLGIDIEFLHLDEPTLVAPERRAQNVWAIAAAIRRLRPDVLFLHWEEDTASHGRIGALSTEALALAAAEGTSLEGRPHRPPLVLRFLANMFSPRQLRFDPALFIDISDVAEVKYQAFSQYNKHLGKPPPSILRESRMVPSRMWGIVSRSYYAEAFRLEPGVTLEEARRLFPPELLAHPLRAMHHSVSLPEEFGS